MEEYFPEGFQQKTKQKYCKDLAYIKKEECCRWNHQVLRVIVSSSIKPLFIIKYYVIILNSSDAVTCQYLQDHMDEGRGFPWTFKERAIWRSRKQEHGYF